MRNFYKVLSIILYVNVLYNSVYNCIKSYLNTFKGHCYTHVYEMYFTTRTSNIRCQVRSTLQRRRTLIAPNRTLPPINGNRSIRPTTRPFMKSFILHHSNIRHHAIDYVRD